MPVIPLCRLAGVRGHREKGGGQGDREGRRGSGVGGTSCRKVLGEARAGPVAPRGLGDPHPLRVVENQIIRIFPFNLKGSMSNDP